MAREAADWRARIALIAAVVILVAWTVSFALDIWVETYDPPASVTPLTLATVGWLFGSEAMSKLTSKPSDPKPKPKPEEAET